MSHHTARAVANWFLLWADAQEGEDAGLTNLKLQKLLYYAQGHHLGSRDEVLFDDRIEAWAHGPVVSNEYHRLKQYGSGPVDVDEAVGDDFDWDDYRDIEQHLMKVWNTYGQYAAWTLREKTHQETPWLHAFNAGEYNVEITKKSLQEFFSN